ncbi:MAG: chromate transporter [Muribaculaceae bacterium]|nr:chromate transporter [Muribaculaceae bacterium]
MNIYIKLIIAYVKIGLFGFGGGYAMLSLIEREIVGSGWITSRMFTDIVAISQMTPGPIGINSATYIGYVATGESVLGSIAATLAVVLPSYMLVLYASNYILKHRDSVVVQGVFTGLRPVVVGLIASAALLLMNKDNFPDYTWSIALSVGAFCVVYFTKIHPIWVIIASGIAGLIIY